MWDRKIEGGFPEMKVLSEFGTRMFTDEVDGWEGGS